MKRAYEIRLETGDNVNNAYFLVIASSDDEAIRKAKKEAAKTDEEKSVWRCVELRERSTKIL